MTEAAGSSVGPSDGAATKRSFDVISASFQAVKQTYLPSKMSGASVNPGPSALAVAQVGAFAETRRQTAPQLPVNILVY